MEVGDVISIPVGDNQFGFGQVVTTHLKTSGGFMIAVFSYGTNSLQEINLSKICQSEILFLGYTFDAKVYHKDWIIIGNYTENIQHIKMPYFRLGLPSEAYIVNHMGKRLKRISEDNFNKLYYHTEIAPIRYENALKVYFGFQEGNRELFEKILYSYTVNSNETAKEEGVL